MSHQDNWIKHSISEFIRQIECYREIWEERLFPAIDDIEQEANTVAQKEWRSLSNSYDPNDLSSPNCSELAEWAFDAGFEHFLRLAPFRQGLINMYVVGLFHFVEQQCVSFYRGAGGPEPEIDLKRVKGWLSDHGIDVTKFNSWPTLERLRLAANCIKHGDGSSCKELRSKELNWFKEIEEDFPELLPSLRRPLGRPLFGQGVYLRKTTLRELTDGAVSFWRDLGVALCIAPTVA